jgi:opacity protein-like surface antigen
MCDRKLMTIAILLTLGLSTTAFAQTEHWKVDFSVGAAPTVGVTGDNLKTGWKVGLGAEREIADGFGLRGDFGYYGLGVSDQALQRLQMPNGNARMFSLTVGPTWHFPISGSVHGYALGGVGWYRRTVEFTQPTVSLIDIIDPWWGYIGSEFVPANRLLGSVTSNAFGGNLGGGVSIPLGASGSELFAEVRYHYANTKATSTTVVPVSFGFRWGGRTLTTP